MEMMYYHQLGRSGQDTLKGLEADIRRANNLAAEIPKAKCGAHIRMKLVYSQFAPLVLLMLRWLDCSCICLLPSYLNLFQVLIYKVYTDGKPRISRYGRKASVNEFYNIIFPSLQRLHEDLLPGDNMKENLSMKSFGKKKVEGGVGFTNFDLEREDECGICLEPCTKVVTPNCCHAMCINCYHDWNTRSESCPFCRGSLKRVKSSDLWVLTCNDDKVDLETVSEEELSQFYLYINSLPKDSPEVLFLMYYEYLL